MINRYVTNVIEKDIRREFVEVVEKELRKEQNKQEKEMEDRNNLLKNYL